ncbi:hypothetical protein VOLCADRAFT_98696 [Volvox carteri f. nagariensis]|uniref:SnoaL-like domain-containing protein n=1 Tax=Volvox carteri f. nagariensis TaxID=3068 RepID=D8UG16_VOLCA|nr:uncharacterized protein VOLCADRAFT_98696 [Volvox carteri f. nagariensis]EFJ41351.1 hypothetical protein VOLCADRAFT_98696 [Volvox carteri f. nagariensis]|eukprot:XP_002957581.1 hypothetical protein VOLCADRAFT_98696 [Volvox carteri f. nagariensis]
MLPCASYKQLLYRVKCKHSSSWTRTKEQSPRLWTYARIACYAAKTAEAVPPQAEGTVNGLTGKDVIVRYYEAYNSGDLDTIASLLAPDVSYHDMIYEDPFVGRDEVLNYLKKVRRTVPADLQFVIEDVTDGDPRAVGITWHVECGDGVVFPFSRGCSFYTLNPRGQITTARDLVESAAKPGSTALKLLAALTPVVRQLGPAAHPSTLKRLPLASAAVWAFYLGYTAYIMLGTGAPGSPAYNTPPEVLQEVLYESLNFFYINIGLDALGWAPVPSVACHPVSEALFNFVAAWSLMALPYMLSDGRSRKLGGSGGIVAWWTGIMFLTNVFYIPYLAQRAAPEPVTPTSGSGSSSSGSSTTAPQRQQPQVPPPPPPPNSPLPPWSPVFGATGLLVGLTSIGWALAARPEYGGLAERMSYFIETMNSNRVFYAFLVDSGLYCVWQAVLMQNTPARYRFVPFFGMAAHLLRRGGSEEEGEEGGL